MRRIDVAGRDVTEYLQTLLRKSGYVFHTSAEKEVVRHIKEAVSYVALNPKQEEKDWVSSKLDQGKAVEYTLPDGSKLKVGQERFRAPEILFDPEIIGLEYPGIQQIVTDSISRTDLDLRKALFSNIVLSGGSTLTKGFGDRLLSEVKKLAVKDMRIKIFAPPERKYSTWIGGSILAGLSTFRKVCRFCRLPLFTRMARKSARRTCKLQRLVLTVAPDVGQYRRLAREPRHYPHQVDISWRDVIMADEKFLSDIATNPTTRTAGGFQEQCNTMALRTPSEVGHV